MARANLFHCGYRFFSKFVKLTFSSLKTLKSRSQTFNDGMSKFR
jgi:hypothetical protein